MLRATLHIFGVILIFLAQVFISGLPNDFNSANLVLVSLIFYLVFDDIKSVMYWLIGSGLLLESVSYMPFGAVLFSMCISIVTAYAILNSWLTNRSLYSLILLTWGVTIVNNLVLWFYSLFFGLVSDQAFIMDQSLILERLLWSLGLNALLMIVIFYILNFINPRLKPFFLIHRR
jgi:hypothetical protein